MEWLSDHQWAAWLGVAVLLVIGELATLDLFLLMLGVAALIGMLAAGLGAGIVVQVLVAVVAAVALLFLLRPSLIKRLHTGPDLRLGHGKLVGEEAVVTVPLSTLVVGRILLAGETWSAAPVAGVETIAAGVRVQVAEIRGATAYVRPLADPGAPPPSAD